MKSLQGQTLVAKPDLRDPNFARTVILLVTHNKQGALGLVLNRPTSVSLPTAWKQVSESPCALNNKIFLGGPCQGPLMALHTEPLHSDSQVRAGVYFTAKPEELASLVSIEDSPQRYFVGYAGWSAGQLENELKEGSWLVVDLDDDDIFTADEHLDRFWEKITKQVADAWLIAELNIKHVPDDPSLN